MHTGLLGLPRRPQLRARQLSEARSGSSQSAGDWSHVPLEGSRTRGAGATVGGLALWAAVIGMVAGAVVVGAQVSGPGTQPGAALSGVVVDDATGTAVPGALVAVGGRGASAELTDRYGRFVLQDVPAGRVTVRVSKAGYLDGGFGAGAAASGGPVSLLPGAWTRDLRVRLRRSASLAGTVRDDAGHALADVFVQALANVSWLGRRGWAVAPRTRTDEQGRYRIAGLMPGRYVIEVPSWSPVQIWTRAGRHFPIPPPPRDGRPLAYPATFAPGVARLDDASAVDVGYGETRTGLDIVVTAVPAFRISGIVTGPIESAARFRLRLVPAGADEVSTACEMAEADTGGDGRFSFPPVPPGSYTIDVGTAAPEFVLDPSELTPEAIPATPSRPGRGGGAEGVDLGAPGLRYFPYRYTSTGESEMWGRQAVVLGEGDASGLIVRLHASSTMSGQIEMNLATDRPQPTVGPAVELRLEPANPFSALVQLRAEDRSNSASTFTIRGLRPGKYFLRVGPRWMVKQIAWQGREYASAPFDIGDATTIRGVSVVVTDESATLSGVVAGADSWPASRARVVLFPASSASWNDQGLQPSGIRIGAASPDGGFLIDGLPAGTYLAIAIGHEVELGPDLFTAAQRRGTRVTLSWGQRAHINLQVNRDVR